MTQLILEQEINFLGEKLFSICLKINVITKTVKNPVTTGNYERAYIFYVSCSTSMRREIAFLDGN